MSFTVTIPRARLPHHGGGESRGRPYVDGFFRASEAAGAIASDAGERVTPRTAIGVSAVFACVRNLAEDLGKLPHLVYRRLPVGQQAAPEHPLQPLLNVQPNAEMNPIDFRQAMIACALLFGAGWAEIERDGANRPLALWPIQPWRMQVRRDSGTGALQYLVDGSAPIRPENLFIVLGFSFDGVLGEMVTLIGRESMGLTIAAQKFAARFFGNGSRPSGVFSQDPGPGLTDEQKENFAASFRAQSSGRGAHGSPLLPPGVKWTKTGADPEEAQMLETRQFQVEDVARWFRMPPHKVGHYARAQGWSTLEATNIDYVTDTLMPWAVRLEQETARKLLSPADQRAYTTKIDFDELLRGDSKTRAEACQIQFMNGALCPDEWRARENRNPIEGGHGAKFFRPANLVPIDAVLPMPDPTKMPPANLPQPTTTGAKP